MRRFGRWFGLSVFAFVSVGCVTSGGGGAVGGGSTTIAGSGAAGAVDGGAGVARFNNPVNCTQGPDGSLYVCDFDNDRVRKIDLAGNVTTLVNQANFARPFGIAFAGGNLYVQTDANDALARDATTGTVWRVNLATGAATVIVRNIGRPRSLLGLSGGRILMANLTRSVLHILDPATTAIQPLAGQDGTSGFANGTGPAARFDRPYGMCLLPDGDVLVADQNNHRIRRVTLAGVVTTFAGQGGAGYVNGTRAAALFNGPQDVECDALGNVFVGDNNNHRFRKIVGDQVGLLAGDGTAGFRDGSLEESRFFGMEGFSISDDGNYLFVADGTGGDPVAFNRIRKIAIR